MALLAAALSSCGGERHLRVDRARGPGRRRRGGRQPGHRLAAARDPRRLAERRRSASSAARARRSPTCSVVGSRSGTHPAALAGVLDRDRRELPPRQAVRRRRARHASALAGTGGGTPTSALAPPSRSPSRRPSARSSSRSTPATRTPVQHYLSAPAITPSTVTHHDARAGRARRARRPLPRALPGHGHARADDRRTDGAPGLVSPAARATTRRPTSRSRPTTASRCSPGGRAASSSSASAQGEDVIYNSSYQPIATVRAGNGYHADLHEFLLTPAGHRVDRRVRPDRPEPHLRGRLGARRCVYDSIVQEIDIKTGLVMWEWHALGHIPLRDSYARAAHQRQPGTTCTSTRSTRESGQSANVLLSARNTWTIYDVNMHTGGFIWRIGGQRTRASSAAPASASTGSTTPLAAGRPGLGVRQRLRPAQEKQSRGLLLDPTTATHTVTLVKHFTNPTRRCWPRARATCCSLPGGNWLMGYGGLPNFTEYDSSGHVLLDAHARPERAGLPHLPRRRGARSRRRRRRSPRRPPAAGRHRRGELERRHRRSASWKVLAGSSASRWRRSRPLPSSGFETTIPVSTAPPYVAVARSTPPGRRSATSRRRSSGRARSPDRPTSAAASSCCVAGAATRAPRAGVRAAPSAAVPRALDSCERAQRPRFGGRSRRSLAAAVAASGLRGRRK